MAKIILTTGGTGGHIFPALAVAEALKEMNPQHVLVFIGSNYGPEARFAEKNGLKFCGLPVRGFLGRGLQAIPAALDMGMAILKAGSIISQFRPDAIAGFGGYASFAPMLAGCLKGVPTLLHEQNAIAGATNRFLAKFAKKICVSLPGSGGFNRQVVVTGNPVRKSIVESTGKARKGGGRLLVLGGSQGAHALNMFIPQILDKLPNVQIRHQTGECDLLASREAYAAHGRDPESVCAFIDDMREAYDWASMVICRSGASTVAELCAAGLPSILVPFPAAIHDHQTCNARILAERGAAFLVPEKELEADRVSAMILEILDGADKREAMEKAAKSLAKPEAAREVAKNIESICAS